MILLYLSFIDDANDKKMFENIYKAYRKQMVTLAMTILKNQDDAEDVVHDVFLKIASKYMPSVSRIDSDKDLRNYLLKATKNTVLNKINSYDKNNVLIDEIDEYNLCKIEGLSDESFVKLICDKIDYQKAVVAIKKLDKKYSDVLYYHLVVGLNIAETSSLLCQKKETTKKQLTRGKKMLLHILKEQGVEI